MKHRIGILLPLFCIIVFELIVYAFGPFGMPKQRSGEDWIFLSLIIAHGMWLYVLSVRRGREFHIDLFRVPELLFAAALLFFLFSYIYASNANMSYAQWFAETSGNIRLAPDSRIQRLNSLLRYAPFLLFDGIIVVCFRLAKGPKARLLDRVLGIPAPGPGRKTPGKKRRTTSILALRGALPLSILSAILFSLALPSFAVLRGIGSLAFIALVPLYPVLRNAPYRWGLFYGVLFGSVQTMLANYWLGTFSLISLHFAVAVLFVEFAIFFLIALPILRRYPRHMVWLLPLMWTAFDYLRSIGFLGYPWGILGSSQYRFLPFIQIASIGGIWAVNLAVHLTNALAADALERLIDGGGAGRRRLMAIALLWAAVLGFGAACLHSWDGKEPKETIRIALIQQNTDPRKHEYRHTFGILSSLTRKVLAENRGEKAPELIAWSETAFVPNIRKWGTMERSAHSLAALVHDFRDFQREIATWLLTGNDDYDEAELEDGTVERQHYNAVVLFSDGGERMQTYRKIRLVPFTEYFPYKEQLPWLHSLLKDFDATLWEKGEVPVVFEHPKARFSSPICFEDSFPGEIRLFILEGAEMILGLSNDFWSRTKVEGEQHFANALFRAVEHRRPLVRSTAGGKTAYVHASGKILAELPYYQADTLVIDAELYGRPRTLYGVFGDWLPKLALFISIVFGLLSLRRRKPDT